MNKGKGFIEEFKKFIMRGNVMDMAVGVIVGGAFTSIVTSLNQDILTPILGIFGGTDFSNLKVTLGSGENAPVLCYGNFITAVINFLITAFVIFVLVKAINKIGDKLIKKEEEAPAEPTTKMCHIAEVRLQRKQPVVLTVLRIWNKTDVCGIKMSCRLFCMPGGA